jgi:hypothetical protein
MNSKLFSQRFNRELALLGFPDELAEKTKAIAKVFKVSRHLANGMIFGQNLPSIDELNRIAEVLEVCPGWLCGKTDKRKAFSAKDLLENV